MSSNQVEDVTSAYRPPDPRRQLNVRIRGSVHAKLAAIVAIWRERAAAEGADADDIDTTYVVETLLGNAVDGELLQWGGHPDTDEKLAAVLKSIRKASKQ